MRCAVIAAWGALSLSAGKAPSTGVQAGLIGVFPLSNFQDQSSRAGIGASLDWAFWQAGPGSTLGLYAAHRRVVAPTGWATFTDLGLDLRSGLRGGLYDCFGLAAERVVTPAGSGSTKLGARFGFGYRFDSPLAVELTTTQVAGNHPQVSTLNLSVLWTF